MVKWRYDEFFDLLEMPCTVFFFPNSVFMIIFFYFILFFPSFFFFSSFLITSCKDGILTSGLLDKTEMVPIFTIPHNVTVWFFPGPALWPRRGEVAGSRGTGSLSVFGILFIVEKMHWLSAGGFAGADPCFPKPVVGTALFSPPSPPALMFHVGSTCSSAMVSLLEEKNN